MPALAETQAHLHRAIGGGDPGTALALLAGRFDPAQRLAIYRHHHRQSLTRHILGRFPTIQWLLGSERMQLLARDFTVAHRPTAPCIAEYGGAFPGFLGETDDATRHPYLPATAAIDWALGEVAVAIDHSPLAIAKLRARPQERLPDLRLQLQPGMRLLSAAWPVDDLVRLRLGKAPPERFVFDRQAVHLQLLGARGAFTIQRLDRGSFAFREALAGGASIGGAAVDAVAADPSFDAGAALAALFAAGLVTATTMPR
ncbi:MAG TPA: DNA-binding domain-containing protein [Devosiaceae bacterium]|jgi:hypothetical protein|nr:DNA-binding domain-containing protein [Devosiaceae bacterium]